MSEYLELTKSTYSKAYQELFKDIVAALVESRDVSKYLKTLVPHFSKFDENEFIETEPYVKPMVRLYGFVAVVVCILKNWTFRFMSLV